jgi:hypothetical protein
LNVAVCLVAYKNRDDILACLDALSRSTHADFSVAICENGGAEAAAALAQALPERMPGGQGITLMSADNPGYAGGVNLCIRATPDADAWWVLNPDTVPEPDAMAALVERLREGDVHCAGSVLYGENRIVQGYAGGWSDAVTRPEMIGRGAPLDAPVDRSDVEARTGYLIGASMIVDRAFVERIGLMRDDYFLYGEEVEWFVRAKRRGEKLGFAPAARVLHHQGTTTGAVQNDVKAMPKLPIYLNERNKLHVVRDNAPLMLLSAVPASFLLLFARYARRRAWKQFGWAFQGWLAGLRNERGRPSWSR